MRRNQKSRLTPPPSSEATPYEVGYRKPPAASQFKPGQSGNPKGRPKGARNKLPALHEERLKTIIMTEAYCDIKVREGRRQIKIPMAQAIFRSILVNAARGQHRSQQLFAQLVGDTERSDFALWDEHITAAIEYKQSWEEELERRERFGETEPEPIPHPDDMIIDENSGRFIVNGPRTKKQKAAWDMLWTRVEDSDRSIADLTAMLKEKDCEDEGYRRLIEDEIALERKIRDQIVKAIGEPEKTQSAIAAPKRT